MNRSAVFLFVICLSSLECSSNEEQIKEKIELPVIYQNGFGPFNSSYSPIAREDSIRSEWNKTYLPVRGIPKEWKAVHKSMIWLDEAQFVYQNYLVGNISKKWYEHFQQNWDINEQSLSKKPFKCFVYTAQGVDQKGRTAFMIDTDNDLDFSDERAFYPDTVYFMAGRVNIESLNEYKNEIIIHYESMHKSKTVWDSLPILIKYSPEFSEDMRYFYSIPRYGKTQLTWKNRKYEILLSNYFSSGSFRDSKIFLDEHISSDQKYDFHRGVAKTDFLELPGIISKVKFRNLGIDLSTNRLVLNQEIGDKKEYSLQQGYLFRPFEAKDFSTGAPISTDNYKGKYLFVDFWGTWCKGCVEQLPELKEIYRLSDKKPISFIGIAADKPENLARFLKNKPIQWPQILSDSVNKLVEIYDIQGYPTNVLVDPKGRVIRQNITLDELKEILLQISIPAVTKNR
jgi:thiol-disulfide isomerase/thioredoxin